MAGRGARLSLRQSADGQWQVHFVASNGEPLGNSETHPTIEGANKAQQAWVRAMVEYLTLLGYTVTEP